MLYKMEQLSYGDYKEMLVPLDPNANKFSRGSLLVAGGSKRFTGAPILAAKAGAKSGSGYVSLLVPESIVGIAQCHLLSIPVIGAPECDGTFDGEAAMECVDLIRHIDAAVIGPGMTVTEGSAAFVRAMLESISAPIVLDADALNALALHPHGPDMASSADALRALVERNETRKTILTPHAGELKRLVDSLEANGYGESKANDDGFDMVVAAQFVSEVTKSIVVAKGPTSYIVYNGRIIINDYPNPAMATAGSGDVLAGVIGSLCAQGTEPFAAACLGAFVHTLSGVSAARSIGPRGVVATDLVEMLALALASMDATESTPE